MPAAGDPRSLDVRLDLLPETLGDGDDVAIVVDVLRMTTTATVLAELGLDRLSVVADIEGARTRALAEAALLLGERDARPLQGFDGGNSPREFAAEAVAGRSAVLCTTNGSAAVETCAGARHVLLGCLRNAGATARLALAQRPARVRLVCAGTEGRLSLDDVTAAGHIVAALAGSAPRAILDDAALMAKALAASGDPSSLMAASRHGRALARKGFAGDVTEAARLDVSRRVMVRLPGSVDTFQSRQG